MRRFFAISGLFITMTLLALAVPVPALADTANVWSAAPISPANNLISVWGSSASDVFAVGAKGTIWHYDGNFWNPMYSGVTKTLYCVWGSSSSDD